MHPVETYLKTLAEIRGTGGATAETSYYAALETLLDEVGAKLKPKIRAVSQLANTGAGSPYEAIWGRKISMSKIRPGTITHDQKNSNVLHGRGSYIYTARTG